MPFACRISVYAGKQEVGVLLMLRLSSDEVSHEMVEAMTPWGKDVS